MIVFKSAVSISLLFREPDSEEQTLRIIQYSPYYILLETFSFDLFTELCMKRGRIYDLRIGVASPLVRSSKGVATPRLLHCNLCCNWPYKPDLCCEVYGTARCMYIHV